MRLDEDKSKFSRSCLFLFLFEEDDDDKDDDDVVADNFVSFISTAEIISILLGSTFIAEEIAIVDLKALWAASSKEAAVRPEIWLFPPIATTV